MATHAPEGAEARETLLRRVLQLIANRSPAPGQVRSAGAPRALSAGLALCENSALLNAGNEVLAGPFEFPEDSIMALFDAYLRSIEETGHAPPTASSTVHSPGEKLDLRILAQITRLLVKLQRLDMLDSTLPAREAAFVLYSLFVTELLMYGQDPKLTSADLRATLAKNVSTIFRNWLLW